MLRQAVVLVGGLGTRLSERTRTTPKPMLDVGGRPFVEYLLDEITRYRTFARILLLSGHCGEQFTARYDGMRWRSADVRVQQELEPLGTGGALLHAGAMLEQEFILLNGDSFFDFNFLDLAAEPMTADTLVRMALKREQVGDRYGRIDLRSNRVARFLPPSATTEGAINAGVYLVSRRILSHIDTTPCSLEQVVLPRLAEQGHVEARVYDGYFIDIGVPADFERAQTQLPSKLRRPAVFFDRDGVLNKDNGYVHSIDEFEWTAGAREAVRHCNDSGYLVFVVSNQAGVARAHYGIDAVEKLHSWIDVQLAERGAHVDEFQYCPYHVDAVVPEFRRDSDRRKPAPGMLLDCLRTWPVDIARSFLIGDQSTDIAAARGAGLPGYLFTGGNLADFLSLCLGDQPVREAQAEPDKPQSRDI